MRGCGGVCVLRGSGGFVRGRSATAGTGGNTRYKCSRTDSPSYRRGRRTKMAARTARRCIRGRYRFCRRACRRCSRRHPPRSRLRLYRRCRRMWARRSRTKKEKSRRARPGASQKRSRLAGRSAWKVPAGMFRVGQVTARTSRCDRFCRRCRSR